MISIIITTYKEEKTIQKVIENILDPDFSGIGKHTLDKDFEIIICAPDKKTLNTAQKTLNKKKYKNINSIFIKDPGKGKPIALNMCFKKAKADWLLLTDGDVFFEKNAVYKLIDTLEKAVLKNKFLNHKKDNKLIGAVTGRPVSLNKKTSMLNYWGNLLSDAAHHKRKIDLSDDPKGLSTKFIPKRKFFPISGYISIIRNINIKIPNDCLVDDAYISYTLINQNYQIKYAPKAKVKVKYADNLNDYFKQKKRSTGGFVQLWKYGIVKEETKTRGFKQELEYFWFPLKYANSLKELIWSIILYPVRFLLWLQIYWERKILKKNFAKTWVRIESTK